MGPVKRILAAVLVAGPLALVAGALAAIIGMKQPAIYESHALMIIDQPRQIITASDAGVLTKLNALRFKYAALVTTAPVIDPVARQLKQPPGRVRAAIRAQAARDALMVEVTGRSGDPAFVRSVTQATVTELVKYADREQRAAGIPEPDRISFAVIQPATAPIKTEPDSQTVLTLTATVFGGVLALSAVVVYRLIERRTTL